MLVLYLLFATPRASVHCNNYIITHHTFATTTSHHLQRGLTTAFDMFAYISVLLLLYVY